MSLMADRKIVGCPPDGDPHSKICFVGEAPGADEMRKLKPFVGASGHIFEQALHGAGMFRGQAYITNLIKHKIDSIDRYYNAQKGTFTDEGRKHVALLAAELRHVTSAVIVPMGLPATAALLGEGTRATKVRGYTARSTEQFGSRKVIPTLHPASCLYGGNFINIHYITHDFLKASQEMESNEFHYRKVTTIVPDNFEDAIAHLNNWREREYLGIDIETTNYEVSAMGFSVPPGYFSLSIVFGQHFTDEQEMKLWDIIAEILEAPTTKIIQNHMFDVYVLMDRMGIRIGGEILDTMIGHSILYPDFLKSQAFLASIYDNVPYWKSMVRFDNIKDDS